jgi:hypothetical protein
VLQSLVPRRELSLSRTEVDWNSFVRMSFAFERKSVRAVSQSGLSGSTSLALRERRGSRWLASWVRLLLCHVLAVGWLLLLGAGSASARSVSGTDVPAPMCDPEGASVDAGEDIPEVDHGRFEALPCEAQLLLAGWRLDAPELGSRAVSCNGTDGSAPSTPAPPPVRYEGACELGAAFPERAEPMPAAFSEREGLAPRRGHARTLFRPPVVRA